MFLSCLVQVSWIIVKVFLKNWSLTNFFTIYIYIYIYTHTHTHVCIYTLYIYIYIFIQIDVHGRLYTCAYPYAQLHSLRLIQAQRAVPYPDPKYAVSVSSFWVYFVFYSLLLWTLGTQEVPNKVFSLEEQFYLAVPGFNESLSWLPLMYPQ